MQDVAAEMNLSETAFLVPGFEPGTWGLRWFTPTTEVDLCGHATLASAHVLWETERLDPWAPACFDTRSGRLTATSLGPGRAELDLPALVAGPVAPPAGLLEALGLSADRARWVGRSRHDLLVEVATEADVAGLAPDHDALAAVDARGVIVTAASTDPGFDLVSRFFAPRVGVPEDPVTGSAHCVLAPYWAARLGRDELLACQLSARRGELGLRLAGDRVAIAGGAVTVLRGELLC
jgi:PhzF family phenazine biosynthesis protein